LVPSFGELGKGGSADIDGYYGIITGKVRAEMRYIFMF
jgi:hypothetical protein